MSPRYRRTSRLFENKHRSEQAKMVTSGNTRRQDSPPKANSSPPYHCCVTTRDEAPEEGRDHTITCRRSQKTLYHSDAGLRRRHLCPWFGHAVAQNPLFLLDGPTFMHLLRVHSQSLRMPNLDESRASPRTSDMM